MYWRGLLLSTSVTIETFMCPFLIAMWFVSRSLGQQLSLHYTPPPSNKPDNEVLFYFFNNLYRLFPYPCESYSNWSLCARHITWAILRPCKDISHTDSVHFSFALFLRFPSIVFPPFPLQSSGVLHTWMTTLIAHFLATKISGWGT